MYTLWKLEDSERLKKLYEKDGLSLLELLEHFPSRTDISLSMKIKKMKLRHTIEQTINIKKRMLIGNKNPMFGKNPITKGYTKETMECLREGAKKLSSTIKNKIKNGETWGQKGEKNPAYGKPSILKGYTKYTLECLRLGGEKCSKTKKEQWKLLPEEEKERRRTRWAMAGLKCKKKLTSIELKLHSILDSFKVNYIKTHPMGRFVVDAYLPDYNTVIECNGDYWHANPAVYAGKILNNTQLKNVDRDNKKMEYLNSINTKCIVLWEKDIKYNTEGVIEIIKNIL